MKVWTNVRNVGPDGLNFVARATIAEELGFDTIGLSDHIVEPVSVKSPYPYNAEGSFPGVRHSLWVDAVVSLSFIAAATTTVEVATSVLVLPLREPLTLAKQIASIDALSGGRVALGIGSGWLEEEFNALGVDFSSRGRRTDDHVALLRMAWKGQVSHFSGQTYDLPVDVLFEPQPAHFIPILIGGSSAPALRRAGKLADGWCGLFPGTPSVTQVRTCLSMMHSAAIEAGRDPSSLRRIVSLGQLSKSDLVSHASMLAEIGVGEIAFRADLEDRDATSDLVSLLHEITPHDVVILDKV